MSFGVLSVVILNNFEITTANSWKEFGMKASLCLLILTAAAASTLTADPFVLGDVFASVGNGQVKVFSQSGVLKQTLNTGTSSQFTTGSSFDSSGNFYVTTFFTNVVSKFDSNGTLLNSSFSTGFNSNPESIAFDRSGNFYVGQADGMRDIRKFDSTGAQIGSFAATTGPRGTDWIDLAADQSTIFYTSEGGLIRRFDTSTNTQLANFANVGAGESYALRILADGGVLVAHTDNILRLDSSGAITTTYTIPGATGPLFSINLDPDGTSFWTGELGGGDRLYKVDIASGNVLTSFSTSPFSSLGGVSVFGEITEGGGGGGGVVIPEPATIALMGASVAMLLLHRLRKKV